MRLAIIGCNGRMGKELLKLAASNNYINQFSEVVGISQEDDAEKSLQGVDVVIDFSTIESSLKHAALCAAKNIKYVCGVTGFSQEQLKAFDECARKNSFILVAQYEYGSCRC
jgi:4-hydroxy-tetrahydrodipicolinate reductase